MPKRNQRVQIPDGRWLGYDERGPSDGKPLFYFHGSPSSRVEAELFIDEPLLDALNVRLIAVDRPGFGLSDFQAGRRLLNWPQDVIEIANHLNIERFSILAYSLGGPYGLACAFAIPERLNKVGIVSGAAMFTDPELVMRVNEGTRRFLNLPRENPFASRLFLGGMRVMARIAPGYFVAQANSLLPESDSAVVAASSVFQKGFIRMVREALRQGTRGAHYESLLTITEYGFRLQDIPLPLMLWHGEEDRNIPVEMAWYYASEAPNCQAKILPNEGHLSLFKKYASQVIQNLVNADEI